MKLETVKVKHDTLDFVVINKCDLNDKHELYEESEEKKKKKDKK